MRALACLLLLSLAACGEAEQRPPAVPAVTPQPIGYPDIEVNALHGASCAYGSGKSMAPVVIAFADEAVMKIDGAIVRFQVDADSEGARLSTRTRYLAPDRVLLLTIEGECTSSGHEAANFDGSVRLLDGAGAVLFETAGTVQCGS
jgi:hypothetical protein